MILCSLGAHYINVETVLLIEALIMSAGAFPGHLAGGKYAVRQPGRDVKTCEPSRLGRVPGGSSKRAAWMS